MLKSLCASRRLSAAALAAVSALSWAGLANAQTVINAADDVTVRPSGANQHGGGTQGLFIKNSSGQNNNGTDSVGYVEFDFNPGDYPTGFRSAAMTVHPTDQYFTNLAGTAPNIAVQHYFPEYNYKVYGLPDGHPNENFNEAALRSNGWSAIDANTAINVGPTTTNNTISGVGDYYGLFRDGFTLNPRPDPRTGAGYTNPEPGWVVPDYIGQGTVRDTYRNDPDLNTYSYATTNTNGVFKSATPDGVPDNSETDVSGNAENDLTFDLAEWINANDHNNIATFVIKRIEEGDGGASFFARTPTLTVTPGLPVYWDIDGNNPGAGGATPSGTWDGTATNFNINSAGAGAPADITPLVTSADTAVFGAGGDATGSYIVTLTGTRKAYQVNIADGNVTLTGGTLSTRAVDVAAGASATINSIVTGGPTGSFTKKGGGTLTLTANNTYTGGTAVEAGTLQVNRLQNGAITVTGGTLRVAHSAPTGSNPESGDNTFVSKTTSLTMPGTGPLGSRVYAGTLDLTNNDLIIDYTGASPILDIEDMVRAGFNGGDFLGKGITTSIGEIDNSFIIAVADNASLAAPFGTANGGELFSGVDVDLTSVLVKFTNRVDLNLDGVVTPADATIFGTNYDPGQPAVWATGDLDYDGFYTPNDATVFGTFYDPTLESLPEPASLATIGVLGLGLIRRRRQA